MKVTINGVSKEVIPVSKLTFSEFNRILIKGEVTDIIGYLALFFDLERDQIMQSELSTASLPALHATIFDCDIMEEVKRERLTIDVMDKYYSTNSLDINTFGQSYFFELRKQGSWNSYELSLYALALSIVDEDTDDVYEWLTNQRWTKVLPPAFFLLKRTMRRKLISRRSLIGFTWELKRINFRIRFYQKKYQGLEKNSLQRISVKDLM